MERRKFLQQGTLAGLSTLALSAVTAAAHPSADSLPAVGKPFNLNYAPHDGMFKNSAGSNVLDQIQFMYDQGFRSFEDNGLMNRDVAEQEKIGNLLAKLGMQMGVFVIDGGDNWKTSLTTGKQEFRDTFVKVCRKALETAKRVNAKWATFVPGYFERNLPMGLQTANVIEALRPGAAILEPHGLIMVLEPLSDNADLFLRTAEQSYMVCKAVNSPSCKILYDIYHMQRNTGNLIPVMDLCWEEIAYIQIGDNPGRKEPTTGEINYKNIFKHLHTKGYKGVLGMEHGNANPGKEGEVALIKAYRESDAFL
ncbi:hydroxypyruvate isomerase family protein [Chitinophaga sancti]|uniref:Hydroxypyruvate isomerase n=1 Tax=Chitinophaga sancti TaxID=1004 RepID=A0A1K1SY47_9BACT|nr:TIM barrel protein [Chitinophaga sancti]WQD60515.1 TIM barrel protein [Chitinophaga sancti]WQG87358.1 TIM barrel protein [Chitinophaga sancti]SFW89258.1 hydroxypyruvate isomerase [Chitinophaga sancti]